MMVFLRRADLRDHSLLACLLTLFLLLPPPSFAAESGDTPHFPIERYDIEGNTLLAAEEVASLLSAYTGADRQVGDIEAARQRLQLAYAEAGYGTVRVTLPEQELREGVVVLRVTEVRIGRVAVEGNTRLDEANVRGALPQLREGETPNTRRLAESLKVANENPGKQTALYLKAGAAAQEMDAVLRVTELSPWRSFVTLDNTGNAETGEQRLGVGFQHSNVANRDQVLTVNYVTSPEQTQDVSIYGLGYRVPLYGAADSVDVFGGYSSVDSGTVADVFTVSGKGTLFGLRYNQHLSRQGVYEHQVIYGLDYREFENDVEFVGIPIGTTLTVSPVTLTYAGRWTGVSTEVGFHVSGARNVPSESAAKFESLRSGAGKEYSVLRAGGDVVRNFTAGWSARMVWEAQYTDEPLVPSEQFGLGGATSVRGFGEREVADDVGYRASFEGHTPTWGGASTRWRALMFHDLGRVARVQKLAGELGATEVGSAGLGLRVAVGRTLSFTLDYAQVVDGSAGREAGETRVHGSVGAVF